MVDFAFLNQILDRSGHIFNRYLRVNTMLIKQIDDIGLEPLEGFLGDLLDVLRPTIEARRANHLGTKIEPEFGGNHHLFTEGGESFAHKLFIRERAVNFGGIEKGDASLEGRTNQCDRLQLICGRSVAKGSFPCTRAREPKLPGRFFPIFVFALFPPLFFLL